MWRFKFVIEIGKVKEEPVEEVQLDALVERSDPHEIVGFGPPQRFPTLPTNYETRQH